jgi:hypothetical protein
MRGVGVDPILDGVPGATAQELTVGGSTIAEARESARAGERI